MDVNNQVDPGPDPVTNKPRPLLLKTSTFAREDEQSKGCPRAAGSWNHPLGKKQLCLINRYDYKHVLKEPVYPCELNQASFRNQAEYDGGIQMKSAKCRPAFRNGTLGKKSLAWYCSFDILIVLARQQLRAECATLPRKFYEPPWRTIEMEDHYDWWGLMLVRGRKNISVKPFYILIICCTRASVELSNRRGKFKASDVRW